MQNLRGHFPFESGDALRFMRSPNRAVAKRITHIKLLVEKNFRQFLARIVFPALAMSNVPEVCP
jgi:hypothetical protein